MENLKIKRIFSLAVVGAYILASCSPSMVNSLRVISTPPTPSAAPFPDATPMPYKGPAGTSGSKLPQREVPNHGNLL